MNTLGKQDSNAFQETSRDHSAINQLGSKRPEWWLNVDYAEVIEMRDAVSTKLNSARVTN